MKVCSVEGCGREHGARGFCWKHYNHARYHGLLKLQTKEEKAQQTRQQFWDRVVKNKNGCWVFTGSLHRDGYGETRANGKYILAHRYVWLLEHGKLPPRGVCVLHRCDNPPCVNPKHLFLGTHTDNMRDCAAKGRHRDAQGENNGRTKLSTKDVLKIRKDTRSQNIIAADYGVSQTMIGCIKLRKNWKHV